MVRLLLAVSMYNCYSIVICNIVVIISGVGAGGGNSTEAVKGTGGIRDSRFSLPI